MVPPIQDPAQTFYQGEPGHQYHEVKRGVPDAALPWILDARTEKLAPYIQPGDVVFEFGVGSGWNLARLRCARRIGYDVAEHVAQKVRALGIEFTAELGAVADSTVDVVICHQTLEHLTEPFQALKQMLRVVRPGGRLILHVPWECERRCGIYHPDEPNHHLYNWNAQNIGNLVSLAGFKVKSVRNRAYGYDRFAAVLALKLRLGELGFRFLRRALILVRPYHEVELIAER